MANFALFLVFWALFLLSFTTFGSTKVVEHTFYVQSVIERRLCKDQAITVVNGSFPGPTIYAEEGDNLIIHVINESPYNMTIHWHGIKQQFSCWADGTGYITQCPIRPEGALWWHFLSSISFSGSWNIIIYPRPGRSYPFPKPDEEVPIILGEWWNENITELEKQLDVTGWGPNSSDAFLINGYPGDLYSCSSNDGRRFLKVPQDHQDSGLQLSSTPEHLKPGTFKLRVTYGKTYLLRIINSAINPNYFLAIADHKMIVVAADASYTKPYSIDILVLAPGQSYDVLLVANQPPQQYYMATQIHRESTAEIPNSLPASALIIYENAGNSPPKFPYLPDMYDTQTSFNFFNGLSGLDTGPFWDPLPPKVDEHMFITVSLGLIDCPTPEKCPKNNGMLMVTSLNNESFILPTDKLSFLEAFYHNVDGVYEDDFPSKPPLEFDYTSSNNGDKECWSKQSTKVKRIKFNSTVEITN
ncbi:hypothetical protein Leryth_007051 [Lithospermum erythrorhizon]|nr:hypothetical protein Leryth_007051 [Lithospermum erythrorhizon]